MGSDAQIRGPGVLPNTGEWHQNVVVSSISFCCPKRPSECKERVDEQVNVREEEEGKNKEDQKLDISPSLQWR